MPNLPMLFSTWIVSRQSVRIDKFVQRKVIIDYVINILCTLFVKGMWHIWFLELYTSVAWLLWD